MIEIVHFARVLRQDINDDGKATGRFQALVPAQVSPQADSCHAKEAARQESEARHTADRQQAVLLRHVPVAEPKVHKDSDACVHSHTLAAIRASFCACHALT